MLARFDQERQALALMDHPNIAKVLDAGLDDVSRPYFVMELIKGVPITKYCDEARLSPRERLELFISVCHAVQHAHQKGIIHRDLKPSNILVALYDGKPVPKIIDFGVAKATGPRLTEQSIYTEVGALIGTLEYMSPEQAELNNLDVDTRSDIYALGAILYELLTGSVPFSRQQLQAAAFTEMLRMIKEVEPPKPSTKLSGSGTLPSVAAERHTEPKKLIALVRGELDWIVVKCLEKDRARRYQTANGLALDLQRYLANEPVVAGPPSAGYRVHKFIRRNRGPVLAASLLLMALAGGIVGTAIGLVRAERARQAEEERAEGERRAKESAEKRLTQIERGLAYSARFSTTLTRWRRRRKAGHCGQSSGTGWTKRLPSWREKRLATPSSWPGCKIGWGRRTWAWATPPRRRRCSRRPSRPTRHTWARKILSRSLASTTWPWHAGSPESGTRPSNSSSRCEPPE